MPLSGKDLELYQSKKFRQLMLEKARPDDLIPYLEADGIFNDTDKELIDSEKTRRAKIQEILFIVKDRIDSLEPFVKILGKNRKSYSEAIEILGFSPDEILESDSESPVTTFLNNAQFRNFMLENSQVVLSDLVPSLRANNVLTKGDQNLIEEQPLNNKTNLLLNILLTRLQTLNPLMDVMQKLPGTYGPVLEIIANEGIQTGHESVSPQQSSKLNDIIQHVQKCYKANFATFKPMPFYPRVLHICSIWINLRLENKSEGAEPENYKEAILKALTHAPLVLLQGDPGMGKTMTQKKVSYDWATGNLPQYDLVLCARFKDTMEKFGTIWELTLNWMKRRGYLLPEHIRWLQGKLSRMSADPKTEAKAHDRIHVLCVLDGFDDARNNRKLMETLLKSDQMPFLPTAVIVTSRPFALENIHGPSPTLIFSLFDRQQVIDCIVNYVGALGVEDIENEKDKIVAQIKKYKLYLARIPLLLSCLCFIRDQISSDSAVDIYLKICQALVDRQQELKDYPINTPIRALSEMCLSALVGAQGFKPGTVIFTDQDLERFGVDKDLWLKVGLLNADREEGVGKDTIYQLPHATFVEFFAAIATFKKVSLHSTTYVLRYENPLSVFGPSYHRVVSDVVSVDYSLIKDIKLWTIIGSLCSLALTLLGKPRAATVVIALVVATVVGDGITSVCCSSYSMQPSWLKSEHMNQVMGTVKPFSLEQLWTFVLEMAMKEGSNEAMFNTGTFFLSWLRERNIGFKSNEHLFQLMLRLLQKRREGLQQNLAYRIRLMIVDDHTPSSLLSAASQAELPMYRINDNTVYISDLNTVVLVKNHDCNTKLMGGIEKEQELCLCLVEQSVLDSLPDTCMQMGWEKIGFLKIYVTEEPVEQQVTQVLTNQIKVQWIHFHFNLSSQSGINLSPLFNRFTSMNAERLVLRSGNPLIINDLPILFSNQQWKQQIKTIQLGRIQFKDDYSAGMFGEEIKKYAKLHNFILCSKIGGAELLKLIDNLSHCPISTLNINLEPYLSDVSIVNQLIHILTKFPKLELLRLSELSLSEGPIERLCEQVKQMRSLKKIWLHDANVKDEHWQSLRDAGLQVTAG